MSKPTDAEIKAYLDDMVAISLRHGLCIVFGPGTVSIDPLDAGFRGYSCWADYGREFGPTSGIHSPNKTTSIDPSSMSAHERLAWAAAQREANDGDA